MWGKIVKAKRNIDEWEEKHEQTGEWFGVKKLIDKCGERNKYTSDRRMRERNGSWEENRIIGMVVDLQLKYNLLLTLRLYTRAWDANILAC